MNCKKCGLEIIKSNKLYFLPDREVFTIDGPREIQEEVCDKCFLEYKNTKKEVLERESITQTKTVDNISNEVNKTENLINKIQ